MALFGSSKDMNLFNTFNRELINNIIDTQVDVYKVSVSDSNDNLYGEHINKVYNPAVRVSCLVELQDPVYVDAEYGTDIDQEANFSFLRDMLKETANLVLEVGDIIEHDNSYWEIDKIIENQYVVGKNPETDKNTKSFGSNFSVVCNTHRARMSKLNIEKPVKLYNKILKNI
tara:strand:- start:51 stop:566 length:516 start_codon:yes stop_codon:yes gene_type:complete